MVERGPLTPDQRNMARHIRTAGRSLVVILDDILDLSRIESGELRMEQRSFSLAQLLAGVEALLGTMAQTHGLGLRIESPPALDGALIGDPRRLEQTLVGLVGNAIRFTDQGEIQVQVDLLECTGQTARLRFAVCDTGLATAVLRSQMTPFTQVGCSSRRFGGTGLGLSICKRLVELMGGSIVIESSGRAGTRLWFELTLERTPADQALPFPSPLGVVAAGARLVGLHLLVADDDPMTLEVIERLVALEGGDTTLAENGQQVLNQLRLRPQGFDAVVLDVQMPVLDGLSTAGAIRNELGLTQLPIIAVTAGLQREEQERVRAAGIADLLPKPLELEALVTVLTRRVDPLVLAAAARLRVGAIPPTGSPEDFLPIPGIDPTRAALLAHGDRAFFRRLLRGFFADANGVSQRIQLELAAGEPDSAADRLHRLRGAAANLGASELAHSATLLEAAIRADPPDHRVTADLSAQFSRQLQTLFQTAAPWLRETPSPQVPAADSGGPLDESKLASLRWALSTNTPRPARQLFAELQADLTAASSPATVQAMAEAIESLRFDTALKLLDEAADGPSRRGQ